jgi:hypothetical protein
MKAIKNTPNTDNGDSFTLYVVDFKSKVCLIKCEFSNDEQYDELQDFIDDAFGINEMLDSVALS